MALLAVEIHESARDLWPRLQPLLQSRLGDVALNLDAGSEARVLLLPGRSVSAALLRERPGVTCMLIPHAGIPACVKEALEEAGREDVRVFNVHHNAPATAEHALALLFALARGVVPGDRGLRERDWSYRVRERAGATTAQLLYRGTALILGYGSVGQHVGHVLRALGMRVLATRRSAATRSTAREPNEKRQRTDDVEVYSTDQTKELLPQCSALIVSLPSTPATRGLLSTEELALLAKGCSIVNIGRADIFDEDALWEALNDSERKLSYAADVWWEEPMPGQEATRPAPSKHPFATLENVVLSPHHGGGIGLDGTEEARADVVLEILERLSAGDASLRPVDLAAGY